MRTVGQLSRARICRAARIGNVRKMKLAPEPSQTAVYQPYSVCYHDRLTFIWLIWEILTMKQDDIDTLKKLKPASGSHLLDISSAELRPGFFKGTYFLIVQGTKPWITMVVSFSPRIYIRQPDYWEIEVVGTQFGIGLPQTAPFIHAEDVSRSVGTKGVDVVGNNQTIRLPLP
jgi:hypothetical protein